LNLELFKNKDLSVKDITEFFCSVEKTRPNILKIEQAIKDMDTAFDECPYPIFHSFADGMYSREIHINGGHLVVGKIHKNDYFVHMLTGKALVISEFGVRELIAPCSFKAKAGVKHIGFHSEDTVWIDTYRVNSTNVEEAEKEIFADSYEELDDYNKTYEQLPEVMIDQPHYDPIEIKESQNESLGVFSTEDIKKDNIVALASLLHFITPVGRYTNRSDKPNTVGVVKENIGMLIAIEDIKKGDEITIDEQRSLSWQAG
jgi:hypothetical protein